MAAASIILSQEFQIRMLMALAVSHWQKTDLNVLHECLEAVIREPNRSSLPSLALKREMPGSEVEHFLVFWGEI